MDLTKKPQVKIKLVEINSYLSCPLCKGYFIDATTISECLHSFCRSCIIRFLDENSYCPVCELLINKAKPNLKLDKTLQDIVYKLVPELFLNEMRRRQRFYRSYPELATKVTPEEKGEDTERMIFNPRDAISLSIEYSDDSTPGAIVIPQLIGKGADCNNKNTSNELTDEDGNNVIRRFLQCPGMCRVDVLKKFIRNKYNVDTNQYYIDILYKRVPLPDHYTLIDVAYIYSWKRNEPMKFFFKITDINLVTDSFDYLIQPQISRTYITPSTKVALKLSKSIKTVPSIVRSSENPSTNNSQDYNPGSCENRTCEKTKVTATLNVSFRDENDNPAKQLENSDSSLPLLHTAETHLQKVNSQQSSRDNTVPPPVKTLPKPQNCTESKADLKIATNTQTDTESKIGTALVRKSTVNEKNMSSNTDGTDMVRIQKEAIEQFKRNEKKKEFTNVTLDRNNHVEIITKIQKVSNKSGLQIGIKITKQTFKKTQMPKLLGPLELEQNIRDLSLENTAKQMTLPSAPDSDIDMEKSNFLKSIELTAKHVMRAMVPQMLDLPKSPSKRKNSSPLKSRKPAKRPKKFINIQPKAIQNPAVWQMVSNVNQNVSNLSKIVEQMTPNPSSTNTDLQALLYDSYKINIPSSLSVTVKNDQDTLTPSFQKPVQNYIEILKLPDVLSPNQIQSFEPKHETRPSILDKLNASITVNKVEVQVDSKTPEIEHKPLPETVPTSESEPTAENNSDDVQKLDLVKQATPKLKINKRANLPKHTPHNPQTFQRMFEETIKKTEPSTNGQKDPVKIEEKPVQNAALNLSTGDTSAKRNIKDIASKLYKKSKLEHDKSLIPPKSNPPLKDFETYISQKSNTQTISNLHSPKLGLNYTVSVTQDTANSDKSHAPEAKRICFPKLEPIISPKKEPICRNPAVQSPKKSTVLNVPLKYSPSSKEVSSTSPSKSPKHNTPTGSTDKDQLNPDQILEKYNIQNLAQLTANFNFPPHILSSTANQLAALRQAMIYKHFEMQNHQNWLNMNPGPLVQYENYLQSFSKSPT